MKTYTVKIEINGETQYETFQAPSAFDAKIEACKAYEMAYGRGADFFVGETRESTEAEIYMNNQLTELVLA
jgi:hypothetical protein